MKYYKINTLSYFNRSTFIFRILIYFSVTHYLCAYLIKYLTQYQLSSPFVLGTDTPSPISSSLTDTMYTEVYK